MGLDEYLVKERRLTRETAALVRHLKKQGIAARNIGNGAKRNTYRSVGMAVAARREGEAVLGQMGFSQVSPGADGTASVWQKGDLTAEVYESADALFRQGLRVGARTVTPRGDWTTVTLRLPD